MGNSIYDYGLECNLGKTCTSQFFKDDQNSSPKDECNLKSLKTHECMFFQIPRGTVLLLITYHLQYYT
jgi:hypothetical protein